MTAVQPPLRVAILSADLGGGHDAMANAVARELTTLYPGTHVSVDNGLQLGNPLVRRLSRDGYSAVIGNAPTAYAGVYHLWNHRPVADLIGGTFARLLREGVASHLEREAPDVVVSTFPAVSAALGDLRRSGRLDVPLVATLIDPDPGRPWFARGVDLYTTLAPGDLSRIARKSVAADADVQLVRPPVDPRMFEEVDRAAVRTAFDLPADRPVLLVSTGSWGVPLADRELAGIIDATDGVVAVATGRNDEFAQHIGRRFPGDAVRAIPFTSQMPALIRSSDAVLTNSAGMTTMESFAAGTPVVLHKPVPGHGLDGARAVHDDGLAIYAPDLQGLRGALSQVGDAQSELTARAARARGLFAADSTPISDAIVGVSQLHRAPTG